MSEGIDDLPDCMICKSEGIHLWNSGRYAFCLCPAGERRRAAEPDLVRESNATLDKLNARFGVTA